MTTYEPLYQALESRGWAVCDDLAPVGLAPRLYDEGQVLWRAGRFRPAQVGRGSHRTRQRTLRGDAIFWLEPESTGPAGHEFLRWIDELKAALNQTFFLGLNSAEFHFARYPAGTGYIRHVDQFRDSDARKVSITFYLNPAWPADAGGELRLYATETAPLPAMSVLPTQGRMAVFLSNRIAHDVQPAARPRWSLTGWLRTDVANAMDRR
ncbi:MAG: 2OG-Fe(II) oxygenase [Candidimonas sp.]|nr:MAG: 2OG-Fe(II) oxygenase [Candidimonas sp.]